MAKKTGSVKYLAQSVIDKNLDPKVGKFKKDSEGRVWQGKVEILPSGRK